jgi:DNA-binding transcriptional ArsR family regulator
MITKAAKDPLDLMFWAFSHELRLRMLHLLLDRELCLDDFATALRVSRGTLARHATCLRKAGLVACDKHGVRNVYSLTAPQNPVHARLLKCVAKYFADVPAVKKGSRRLKAVAFSSCC